MDIVLISTYELGHQPFGLASPAAWLRREGYRVTCVDLSRERLPIEAVAAADLVGFHLPMHTATRLALPVIERVRALNPRARLCAYGLYAPLNEAFLRERGIDEVLGGEYEADLVALAKGKMQLVAAHGGPGSNGGRPHVPRLAFVTPDRRDLPALSRYAALRVAPGDQRVVGYTEASRGCKHLCRHCPIVPIYQGQFRIVPVDVVIEDIRAQVAAGARHITFGDPDFFNGIRHAVNLMERFAKEFPAVTYDATIKVEHLLKHAEHLATLRRTGCLFVTSAVESIDDHVLAILAKGHTRADFERVVALCREAGVMLSPTFVAFHPWLTLDGYCELLDCLEDLDLVEQVAPIQLTLRLLLPEGSLLLELPEVRAVIGRFDPEQLKYPWTHPDPRVDALEQEVTRLVGSRLDSSRSQVFAAVKALAYQAAGRSAPRPREAPRGSRATVPYLNEPWYC